MLFRSGGGLNSGSVMTNRKLNETVGGMKIMAQGANNLTEYTIRVFVETWVEPQLRLLMKCEQYYESDQTILAVAGKKAAPLMQKFGMDQVTDWLLINDLTLNVNVGMGATDPDARFQHFMQATGAFLQMVPNLPPDANIEEIRNELFGLAGYRDGARFFSGQGDPRIRHLMEQLENAAKQVDQLKMQVQHGLAFEKEKRAIDQRKAQVDLEGIRMQAQGQDPMAEHMLEIQKLRMEAAEAQQKLELERQEAEAELQLKRGTAEAELALERARLAAEIQLEREKLQAELTLQRQKTSAEMQIKASTAERDSETKARAAESVLGGQPARGQIVVVAAGMDVDAFGRHFNDAGGQRGDEFAVMRDEDQRAPEFFQRRVQRLDAFHVEVVGRLVHQQHIGLFQRQLAEHHALLLAAGQHVDGLQRIVAGK